jgi:hypothetical protein
MITPILDEDKQVLLNCTLEWDRERGVLYVHHVAGTTLLRICGLRKRPTPNPIMFGQPIDITIDRDGRAHVQYP